jgi:hypothetical protein
MSWISRNSHVCLSRMKVNVSNVFPAEHGYQTKIIGNRQKHISTGGVNACNFPWDEHFKTFKRGTTLSSDATNLIKNWQAWTTNIIICNMLIKSIVVLVWHRSIICYWQLQRSSINNLTTRSNLLYSAIQKEQKKA